MYIDKRIFGIFFALVLCLFSGQTWALGVSDVELNSYLNQKLDARIQLNAIAASELDTLSVTLTQQYGEGMTRQQLKYEIVETASGNYLKITSSNTIKEPIVSFQLEINWPQGHLVREYSLLIDPQGN